MFFKESAYESHSNGSKYDTTGDAVEILSGTFDRIPSADLLQLDSTTDLLNLPINHEISSHSVPGPEIPKIRVRRVSPVPEISKFSYFTPGSPGALAALDDADENIDMSGRLDESFEEEFEQIQEDFYEVIFDFAKKNSS